MAASKAKISRLRPRGVVISLLSIKAEMAKKDELLKCHELPICHKPTINSHSMLHDWRVKHAFLQCTENTPRFRGIEDGEKRMKHVCA